MKNKFFFIGLLLLIISSCKTAPVYLPSSKQIDVNKYGSYIETTNKIVENIDGELIAIDSNVMVILSEETKKCVTVPVTEVKYFTLMYAEPKEYGWTVPLYGLATITHSIGLILTAPINLIVTAAGENAFQYNNKNITYDKLRMFARFPQGVPPNIDLASIK